VTRSEPPTDVRFGCQPFAVAAHTRAAVMFPLVVRGGRGRFRTCDPSLVRRVLSH
jgi:hypothetical protein